MAKKLEDIIGYSNINPSGMLDCPIDLSTLTEYTLEPTDSTNYNVESASWIDFHELGITYNLSDLVGFGFDSTCCSCDNHYVIVFTKFAENSFVTNGNDKILLIGIGEGVDIATGEDFCKHLYDAISKNTEFTNHFTGYGYLGTKFWLYDHRNYQTPYPDDGFGLFYSSTYKIIIKMTVEYTGGPVWENEEYSFSDLNVTIEYVNGDIVTLTSDEYQVSDTIVTRTCNEFNVTYEEFSGTFTVPCLYFIRFVAKYNGPSIFLYNDYDLNDLTVTLEYSLSEYNKTFLKHEYSVSSQRITKIGPNYYTVTDNVTGNRYTCNFCVIGVRIILDIRARYAGPPISIGDFANPDHIIVEIDTVDENNDNFITMLLKYGNGIVVEDGMQFTDEYMLKEPKLLVTDIGDNIRTVIYKDPDVDWQGEIIIPGIPKIIHFETRYIGDTRMLGSVIAKEQVYAEITKLMNYYTHEIVVEEVPSSQWAFHDSPIVTDENDGTIKTKHETGLFSHITVPFFDPETLRLRCWYESVKIEVGNEFNRQHVVVYMIDENGIVLRVNTQDIEFIDDTVINEDGWNFYRLRLKNPKFRHIIGTYAVPGYAPLELAEDLEFKAVYVDHRNNFREVDYTEHFTQYLSYEDILFIGWDAVLSAINELGLYGTYILTVPKKIGLSNKYDQDWEVLCIDRNAVQANILKTYKEENETWQQRRQLQQTREKWWKIPNQS